MAWVIVGILVLVIIYLSIKCGKKVVIDKTEKARYTDKVNRLKAEYKDLQEDVKAVRSLVDEYQEKLIDAQNKYKVEFDKQNNDLNNYFINQKQTRQAELDVEFQRQEQERKNSLDLRMQEFTRQAQERVNDAEVKARAEIEKWEQAQEDIADATALQEQRFESLLAPLQQYEMKKQQRLFYTIQVPDEYKEDIDFLLNTVSQKVRHPDIINKLVWAEYVKPYLDDTFKRIAIRAEPGIYKLTNIDSGKAYIGKSTDVKKRISDHMKSSIGISSIADQAVHHAILDTGFWNWTIEIIDYCERDRLSELEKYYIDFFKTQEFGYNKNVGGGG